MLKPSKVPAAWLEKYIAVLQSGDIHQVEQLLSSDITVISDGGGKATAFMNAVHGTKDVSALLAGLYRKAYSNAKFRITTINHQPALFYYGDDQVITCQVFEITDGIVTNIYFIRNPDKLKELENSF